MNGVKRKFVGGPWHGREVAVNDHIKTIRVPLGIRGIEFDRIPVKMADGIPLIAPLDCDIYTYQLNDDGTMS